MKNIPLILLLSFFTIQLSAQTLTGVVFNPDTKTPLPDAIVMLENELIKLNEQGEFSLSMSDLPESFEIKADLLGYHTLVIKSSEIDISKKLMIPLYVKINFLDQIVVTASLYRKKLEEEYVSMSILKKEFFDNTVNVDLADALQLIPGVTHMDGQINIRNGGSYSYGVGSRTKLLMDGVSYSSADLGDVQLDFIPVELMDQIEVLKGSASVAHGSSALNGVVNLITKWHKDQNKPKTQFKMIYGTYDIPREEIKWWERRTPFYQNFSLSHRNKKKKLQYNLGAFVNSKISYLESNDDYRGRLSFQTRYNASKNLSFGLNGNVMAQRHENYVIPNDLRENIYTAIEFNNNEFVKTMLNPHFTFRKNKHHFYLNGAFINIWRGRFNEIGVRASSNMLTLQPKYRTKIGKYFHFTAGLPTKYGYSKSNNYNFTRTNYEVGGFSQLEFKKNKWSILGGVRYEVTAIDTVFTKGIPVFRGGANYRISKNSNLRFSWGQGYRIPTIGERFLAFDIIDDLAFLIPNINLTEEKSWSSEIGLYQKFKKNNWNAKLDASVFLQNYTNYVEFQLGLFDNRWPNGDPIFPDKGAQLFGMKPFNIENARILGHEISFDQRLKKDRVNYRLNLGYTYTYPGNLEDDPSQKKYSVFLKNAVKDMFNYIGPDEIYHEPAKSRILQLRSRHMFKSDFSIATKKISFGLTGLYNSYTERFPAYAISLFTITDGADGLVEYNAAHEQGDWVLHARFGYKFNTRFRTTLFVKNLLNHEYWIRPGKMEAPRTFGIQVSATY